MKEIKVCLYRSENDSYVELWKVLNPEKGKPKYYGRYTYADEGIWHYVSDPLGYCELDYIVSNDITFILCDTKGNEYCRYSNAEQNPLPKFETAMKRKWAEIRDSIAHNTENFTADFWARAWNGETTLKLDKWLLSYKDPDLYEKANDYDENWTGCWSEHEIGYEPIPNSEFTYLGGKYQFVKVKHKHDVCGAEWYEFVCTDAPYEISDFSNEDRPWIESYGCMGNWFDDTTHGTMYDKRTAKEKVVKVLRELLPTEKSWQKLLYLDKRYAYELNYIGVAEKLIDRDYHRNNVDDLCTHLDEKIKGKVIYSSITKILELQKQGVYVYESRI